MTFRGKRNRGRRGGAGFYVSPTRVTSLCLADLPTGGAAVIVVSQSGFVSVGTIGVMRNITRVHDQAGR